MRQQYEPRTNQHVWTQTELTEVFNRKKPYRAQLAIRSIKTE